MSFLEKGFSHLYEPRICEFFDLRFFFRFPVSFFFDVGLNGLKERFYGIFYISFSRRL